ncbi:MAG: molecular chaperone DnaJ [Euryarchaeota archaeon]|nr:molecular chaperone DnaJ [Euryarchaeota archaeon]
MSTKRDYYEILGVAKDAPKDQIKASYRKLALKFHPDRNKEAGAEDKFKELSEAYAVLSDDEKRGLYDRFGHAGVDQRYSQEDIFRGADFGDIFGNLGSIFESFFGGMGGFGRQRRSSGPPPGEDLRYDLELTLEDAFRGAKRELRLRRPESCEECKGSGARRGTSRKTCGVCHGRGQVQHATRSVFGSFVQVSNCGQCQGTGTLLEHPCDECDGEGRTMQERNLEVEIPPGVDDGSRLRLGGEGAAGVQGAPRGDLYVFVTVRPDPRFRRDGEHLLAAVDVDYARLALGETISISTVDGDVDLEIPPGTTPGTRLRLKGKGMPELRRPDRRGDLFVDVRLRVPGKLSKRGRELMEELRDELAAEDKPGWFRFRRTKDK